MAIGPSVYALTLHCFFSRQESQTSEITESPFPGYEKYFGERIKTLTRKMTEEEIKEFYKNWATEYEKV